MGRNRSYKAIHLQAKMHQKQERTRGYFHGSSRRSVQYAPEVGGRELTEPGQLGL